jgi:hypothetical protein
VIGSTVILVSYLARASAGARGVAGVGYLARAILGASRSPFGVIRSATSAVAPDDGDNYTIVRW